jgi:phosphate transport system substrate-binding protein
MHSLKIIFAASAFILCMGTPDLSSAKDQDLNSIRITGSKYVFFSVTDLAKTFSHQRPGNEIIVDSSDQGAGVHTILTRSGDALMVLGKLDDEIKMEAAEKGLYLEERIIGWGAVALVAHPGNPVEELSIDQIRKMFSGNFTNWKQVGGLDEPIVLMSRDESISGTEVIFRNLVLQGFPLAQHTVRLFDPDIMRAVWKTKW